MMPRLSAAVAEAATHIARRDAETLLAHLLRRDRAWIFAHAGEEIGAGDLDRLRRLTGRRAAGEPLQYLTGRQEFYGLDLRVTTDTLIPRPETERLVEAVLGAVAGTAAGNAAGNAAGAAIGTAVGAAAGPLPRGGLRILDVGTGSGAIALALAAHLPSARVTACDISAAALEVARENAGRLRLSERVDFVLSDLLAAPELRGPGGFDIVVSNPPYVATAEAATLQPEVLRHEPHTALFAGTDGLDIYRRLLPQAHAALVPEGLLALEFGFGQSGWLRGLLETAGGGLWGDLCFLEDYAGIPRVALARRR